MLELTNSSGFRISFLENGSVENIEAGNIRISLKKNTLHSFPGCNVYLRKRDGQIKYVPLTGPGSPSKFTTRPDAFVAQGAWEGCSYRVTLDLSPLSASWRCSIDIENMSASDGEFDLVLLQDVGLKAAGDGLVNEYYVSQYLERIILQDPVFGAVIGCRQNMDEPTGHPWLMIACRNGAISGNTDGIGFLGPGFRESFIPSGLLEPELNGNCAGESPVVSLQERPFRLAPGQRYHSEFLLTFIADHPEATSEKDCRRIEPLLNEFTSAVEREVQPSAEAVRSLFSSCPLLVAERLPAEEIGRFFSRQRRQEEFAGDRLLSFFYDEGNHVVLKEKELMTDRPHAHIMQAKTGFVPDEEILSTTAFAFGVFNSHLTQGNTNFNTLLSVCTTQFGQSPESGQRIFVEVDGQTLLLGVPSAFEMGFNFCRWIYKFGGSVFQVRTWTSMDKPQVNTDFSVLSGPPARLLITNQFDKLGHPDAAWILRPGGNPSEYTAEPMAATLIGKHYPGARFRMVVQPCTKDFSFHDSSVLFSDGTERGREMLVIKTGPVDSFAMSFVGEICHSAAADIFFDPSLQFSQDLHKSHQFLNSLTRGLSLESNHHDVAAVREILPWYGLNALVHLLTPYGLEQFSGAAWGTRDVSQGPVDLLLATGKYSEARKVICTIFANQHPDGGWPQWWMFDRYAFIRAHEAHGDIFYWCILAVAAYIRTTGDLTILEEKLPYFTGEEHDLNGNTPLSEHLDRLVRMIVSSFIPGTALVPFGGGDWNDSLQPVSGELARKMVSSWTVEMNYQAFMKLKEVFQVAGWEERSAELALICERIKEDFNRLLIRDGILAGYGVMQDDGSVDLLLHPSDRITGVSYSVLPMNRGIISGIFTPGQAAAHRKLVESHLKGPDGVRLMDRPLRYKGGIQEIFRRAESSTFFGREIGLMYVHEHIRYAESLAVMGEADGFIAALRQAIPVEYREIVSCADHRQANCYYSSSDVTFRTRYEADQLYHEVTAGKQLLKGGWRVYSSGPGIYVSMVITRLLGLRIEYGKLVIDPVLPRSMDDLQAVLNFEGFPLRIRYHVKNGVCGPVRVEVNGHPVDFSRENNPYRKGGAMIDWAGLRKRLTERENLLEVFLSFQEPQL